MKNQLQRGEIASLTLKKGEAIRCESGSLWLTFEGDSTDHFLTAGQIRLAPQAGKAVMEALSKTACWSAVPAPCGASLLGSGRLGWFPR